MLSWHTATAFRLTSQGVIQVDRSTGDSVWNKVRSLFGRHNDDDIEQAVIEAREEGELEPEEESMILRILEMDDIQVQDVMTPRTDSDFLPAGTSILETARFVIETGHSRIPIYSQTRDNIVGIAYVKDMLPALLDTEHHNDSVDTIMRPPFFVPETKMVSQLLQEFRARKNHIAVVVDEYGGTSGIVTIEDALEQIVGDIEDEHDKPAEQDIKKLDNGTLILSGRAWLEDLDKLGISCISDEVDTIGGYLCLEAGHVPQAEEVFICNGWRFTIKEADGKQIHTILAEPVGANTNKASSERTTSKGEAN